MSRCLRWWRRRPDARLTLLCLPHAGGAATAYCPWKDLLPETVDLCAVQLPGRQDRVAEAPFEEMEPLVATLAAEVTGRLDKPYAVFGHSMGALIGFELARRLAEQGNGPAHLFVSGARAPRPSQRPRRSVRSLSDDAFVEELRRLNGTPESVLRDPELLRLTLPVLRADFSVLSSYRYDPGIDPVPCPISAFGGHSDPEATVASLEGWRRHTHREFRLRMLPGDHFFVQSSAGSLTRAVLADLLPHLRFTASSR